MYFNTLLAATTMAFLTAQAAGAPSVMSGDGSKAIRSNDNTMGVLVASNPIDACNCPNNCQHKSGSSCKFYKDGNVITATCQKNGNGVLQCQ